jgi:hypothetical protein
MDKIIKYSVGVAMSLLSSMIPNVIGTMEKRTARFN